MSVMSMIVLVVFITMLAWVAAEIWGRKGAGPSSTSDDARVHELTAENAALTKQLQEVHDRLETLERIVTDKPSKLEAEIDALRTLSDRRDKKDLN